MRFRIAVAGGLALFALGGSAVDLAGQRGPGVEIGAGASYFTRWITTGQDVGRSGPTLLLQAYEPHSGGWMELGWTYVPRAAGASSSASRAHVFRAAFTAGFQPGREEGPLTLTGTVGVAMLRLDTEPIQCPITSPLCSEWAPRSGMRGGPVLGAGAELAAHGRVSVFGNTRVYRLLGEHWSPAGGTRWLSEIGIGAKLRI